MSKANERPDVNTVVTDKPSLIQAVILFGLKNKRNFHRAEVHIETSRDKFLFGHKRSASNNELFDFA